MPNRGGVFEAAIDQADDIGTLIHCCQNIALRGWRQDAYRPAGK